MKSSARIIWDMWRRHATSPYLFFWRTVELLKIVHLAWQHGYDLTAQLDLDAGCGNGIVGQAVVSRIRLGLDPSRGQLHWATQKAAYAKLLQGSATAIPLRSRTQGSVLCNCVMEHIPDDRAAFTELARVVAPGGYLLFTLASAGFYRAIFGQDDVPPALRQQIDASLSHVHYYAASEVRQQLTALGLEVLATEAYMLPTQARWWYRLRAWESGHPRTGWQKLLAQLLRIPVSLALIPLIGKNGNTDPQRVGAGLAVVARRQKE